MRGEKEFLEIKNWFLIELQKHYLLNEYLVDIIEFTSTTEGVDIFKDGYLSDISVTFLTSKNQIFKISELNDISNHIWEVRERTSTGMRLPTEMFEEMYAPEIRYLDSFLTNDLFEEFKRKLWDFYLDVYHDYENDVYNDIIYKK